MIRVLTGDILQSNAQTLVNTVNCVGIMGKGIALEFRKRFPEMFKDYQERCRRGEVVLGRPYLYKSLLPPWVLNFPTKGHWRSVSSLRDIIKGLDFFLKHYKEWGITSIAVPPLGCGHGQLEWRIVGPTLYRYLARLDIPVELYAPHGTPHEELKPEFLDRKKGQEMPAPRWVKPAWIALVEILKRIQDEQYHWPVGRTIFQKIAFVATEEGLPTGLEFKKSSYGPFSADIKSMIAKLNNHQLIQERELGKMFEIRVGPTYSDARKAYASQIVEWESVIEKTTDLFLRANTNEAEIIATVLFTGKELTKSKHEKPTECDVYESVLQWKQKRRPPIGKDEVASTIRNLAVLKWLDVTPSRDLPVPDEVWA
ncbi:MAG: Macro domain protein [Syntrophorhabdus sp. PtaU1.Bin050]|nr:MAG: Macro domain protein [Syntrophorhabdus sp. PtaU1.Bin050]